MIARDREHKKVVRLLRDFPVVAIVGARQVGKSTLANSIGAEWKQPVERYDLEDDADLARLADPLYALRPLRGLVILDEIQRTPELFRVLRVLADRPRTPARFLILSSASPELLRQSSESLAGRISYHELGGFAMDETGQKESKRLWRRGGFPRSYLSRNERQSFEWRREFIRTFLERDLPQLGIGVSASTMRRFWIMLGHYHGQVWNASEFARSFGVADTTVRTYLDHLASALVVRVVQPWHENISKRQVKAPRVYVKDSGLLHSLLGLPTQRDMEGHPKVGASWEGFVIEQIIRFTNSAPEDCYFWSTHTGAELDLLIVRGRHRLGFEVKLTSAPKMTKSIHIAREDLRLDRLALVHAGEKTYDVAKGIRALSITNLQQELCG